MTKFLITGGTGSFGKAFVKKILEIEKSPNVVVFSRDELKQFEMQNELKSSTIKYILGDVRDYSRLNEVCAQTDIIVHAAAMKQIPASENNPLEAIKTNIGGAENVIRAAIENGVKKVIALSTDKAANPANLYGATKLCSDKLFVAANYLPEQKTTKFSAVRYGNVLGSRGSVIPFFKEISKTGSIPITHPEMTRFWISLEQGVEFVFNRLQDMNGGEIFVPKIPSFKVTDVANIVAPGIPHKIIGIRPGEKLHEVMITEDDSHHTIEYADFYSIVSPSNFQELVSKTNGKSVEHGFKYSSDTNKEWFTHQSFIEILKKNQIL